MQIIVSPSFAQVHPSIEWKTLETPHYKVIFDAKQKPVADFYATRLEENYDRLHKYFKQFPAKTIVVLNDNTDSTNGFATPIPYPYIMIYPVLPIANETIGEYGDWVSELLVHENTHIVTFEYSGDIVRGLRSMFGSIVTPTLLMPRWWTEGVAVEIETRTSNHGRLRSKLQDASIRAYNLSSRWEKFDISEINETTVPSHPYGARPYIFGSLIWSQMIAEKGEKVLHDLHAEYGERLPYLLNEPAREIIGSDYINIFYRMKSDIFLRVEKQMAALNSLAPIEKTALVLDGVTQHAPRVSPDGSKVLYISRGHDLRTSVRVYDINSKKITTLQSEEPGKEHAPIKNDGPPVGTISKAAWFSDSERIVYDRIDPINRFQETSDLWIYDLKNKKNQRISKSLRAREPAVSPAGDKIAFVKLGANSTALGLVHVETKAAEILFEAPMGYRVGSPTFFNNQEIIYSMRDNAGSETLFKYNLITRQTETVLSTFKEALSPNMTSRGLVFLSGENGVYNAYLADADLKNATPITHSLTAVLGADISSTNQDLIFSELTDNDQKIFLSKSQEWTKLSSLGEKKLPHVEALLADRYPKQEITHSPVKSFDLDKLEDYKASEFLAPRYWIPWFSFTGNESTFGAIFGGMDPLTKHAYDVNLSYASNAGTLSYLINYINNNYEPTLQLTTEQVSSTVAGTTISTRERLTQGFADWVLNREHEEFHAGFGWIYDEISAANKSVRRVGPSGYLGLDDIQQTSAEFTPHSGKKLQVGVTNYVSDLSDYSYYQTNLIASTYFSKFLPQDWTTYWVAQAQYTDHHLPLAFWRQQTGLVSPYNPYYLRGDSEGFLIGRNFIQGSFELRFPVREIYRGSGTLPFFIKRLHGAVLVDAMSADGAVWQPDSKSYLATESDHFYFSKGAELRMDITLGYALPLTIIFGAYSTHEGGAALIGAAGYF